MAHHQTGASGKVQVTPTSPMMLDIGIDVSAKYRGAWCEGTIIRRDEQLNCKVTFTDKTLGSTMSKHTDIDGNIAVSSSVYARHGTTHKMHKATIQKITDGTLYTVRFHDGDERTLRRNAVTLMGPQHFNDGYSLGEFPLTDPDTFSNPAAAPSSDDGGSSRKRRRQSEGGAGKTPPSASQPQTEPSSVSPVGHSPVSASSTSPALRNGTHGTMILSPTTENTHVSVHRHGRARGVSDVGEVGVRKDGQIDTMNGDGNAAAPNGALVETACPAGTHHQVVLVNPCEGFIDDTQLWWPAIVVPTAEIMRDMIGAKYVDPKVACVVRFFEDNLYAIIGHEFMRVMQRHTNPFQRFFSRPSFANHPAVHRALRYLDEGILPDGFKWKTWSNKCDVEAAAAAAWEEEHRGTGRGGGAARWNPNPVVEKTFLQSLTDFMARMGMPIKRTPSLAFKDLDLFKLYSLVTNKGGHVQVTTDARWRDVYGLMLDLDNDSIPASADRTMRAAYDKYLRPYEDSVSKSGGIDGGNRFPTIIPTSATTLPTDGAVDGMGAAVADARTHVDANGHDDASSYLYELGKTYRCQYKDGKRYMVTIEDRRRVPAPSNDSIAWINQYYVHYTSWAKRYDQWVDEVRISETSGSAGGRQKRRARRGDGSCNTPTLVEGDSHAVAATGGTKAPLTHPASAVAGAPGDVLEDRLHTHAMSDEELARTLALAEAAQSGRRRETRRSWNASLAVLHQQKEPIATQVSEMKQFKGTPERKRWAATGATGGDGGSMRGERGAMKDLGAQLRVETDSDNDDGDVGGPSASPPSPTVAEEGERVDDTRAVHARAVINTGSGQSSRSPTRRRRRAHDNMDDGDTTNRINRAAISNDIGLQDVMLDGTRSPKEAAQQKEDEGVDIQGKKRRRVVVPAEHAGGGSSMPGDSQDSVHNNPVVTDQEVSISMEAELDMPVAENISQSNNTTGPGESQRDAVENISNSYRVPNVPKGDISVEGCAEKPTGSKHVAANTSGTNGTVPPTKCHRSGDVDIVDDMLTSVASIDTSAQCYSPCCGVRNTRLCYAVACLQQQQINSSAPEASEGVCMEVASKGPDDGGESAPSPDDTTRVTGRLSKAKFYAALNQMSLEPILSQLEFLRKQYGKHSRAVRIIQAEERRKRKEDD